MPNLTDLTVRALPEGLHFDERTPGFAIRIGKHRKTWLVVKQPNRTKVRIGHYPNLSLQEARRRAQVVLGTPLLPRTTPSFPDALDAFLAQDRWKASTKKMLEWSLRRHFKWQKPIDKIAHEDVASVLDAIEGKSERAHAFANVRIFFNWCIPRYIPHSPCTGLKVPRSSPGIRVLTDDELKRVWIAADENDRFGLILKLLITTGQRRGEIARLQIQWLTDSTLTLPANVVKNGRQHTIPLSQRSLTLATALATKNRSTTPFSAWSKSLKSIQKKSATADWSLHDLRRTFATNLASLGVPIHVTERLLNHISGSQSGIVGVYQKYSYWKEMTAAMSLYDEHCARLIAAD